MYLVEGETCGKAGERFGISASTLNRTVKSYAIVKNTSADTVQKLCYGMGISFKEFWKSPFFIRIEYNPDEE